MVPRRSNIASSCSCQFIINPTRLALCRRESFIFLTGGWPLRGLLSAVELFSRAHRVLGATSKTLLYREISRSENSRACLLRARFLKFMINCKRSGTFPRISRAASTPRVKFFQDNRDLGPAYRQIRWKNSRAKHREQPRLQLIMSKRSSLWRPSYTSSSKFGPPFPARPRPKLHLDRDQRETWVRKGRGKGNGDRCVISLEGLARLSRRHCPFSPRSGRRRMNTTNCSTTAEMRDDNACERSFASLAPRSYLTTRFISS